MSELEPVWPEAPRHVPDAPYPRYRFVGGRHPHPRTDPAGSLYGLPAHPPGLPPERWREDRSWLAGIDLYHAGYLWEAHEAWEACFFASKDPAQRALVQALIQLAAALIKEHVGNARGVEMLVSEVRRKLGIAVTATPERGRIAGADPRRLLDEVDAHFVRGARAPRIEVG